MNSLRRALNLVAAIVIATVAVALGIHVFSVDTQNPIPVTFMVLFAAAPALAHIVVTVVGWRRSPASRKVAVLGLGLASVCCFVSVLVWAVMLELLLKRQMSLSGSIVALALALLVLPISGVVNIAHFRSNLIEE